MFQSRRKYFARIVLGHLLCNKSSRFERFTSKYNGLRWNAKRIVTVYRLPGDVAIRPGELLRPRDNLQRRLVIIIMYLFCFSNASRYTVLGSSHEGNIAFIAWYI